MASVSQHPERKGMTYRTVIHALLTKSPRPPIDQIIKALKEDFPRRAKRDHKKDIGKVLAKLIKGKLKLEKFVVSIAPIPENSIEIKGIGKFEPKKPKVKKEKKVKEKPEEVKEENPSKAKTKTIVKPNPKAKPTEETPEEEPEEVNED